MGIMDISMNRMNINGKVKAINVTKKVATPNNMEAIPRYIGFLLMRNASEVTKTFGIS